jgi:hypothetical protein
MEPTMFDKAREALGDLMATLPPTDLNEDLHTKLSSCITWAEGEVEDWTDAATDNGAALDLACDQLAAGGHEEGGPEFMEDWRDLFMGQVDGAKILLRDTFQNCAGDEDDRCFYAENDNPNKVKACPCDLPCEEATR